MEVGMSSPREEMIEKDHGEAIVTKRPRAEDEKERELEGMKGFREFWEEITSPHLGPLTATSTFIYLVPCCSTLRSRVPFPPDPDLINPAKL